MSLTPFNYGVSSFGTPVLGGSADPIVGTVFFVDSATGSDTNSGMEPSKAFATIDRAVGKCTASKGDIIYVMPNHAETITGAGGITVDVAGVSIIGLGEFNQRPRVLLDGALEPTVIVSAADTLIRNIVFASGHSDVATCIELSAVGLWVDKCEFVQNTTDENFLTCINASGTTDGGENGLKVTDCYEYQVDASTSSLITVAADVTGFIATGNVIITGGVTTALIILATGKDLKGCFIAWNFCQTAGAEGANLFISCDTTGVNNAGIIAHNRIGHADTTSTHIIGAVAGARFFDNLSTSVTNASGFVLPAADTNG